MHDIEPFYNWRNKYIASEDPASPFFDRQYSEFEYSTLIYNFYIHPQWDDFGSETLFIKILFADYEAGFAIIEMFGEWNDTIGNDIMFLKRDVIDLLIPEGITNFILIGENVLNFHASDDSYYEEWFDDIEDGWIVCMGFREHVMREFNDYGIDQYFVFGERFDDINWRTFEAHHLFEFVKALMTRRLGL
jgi:hypothetical protein